MTVSSLSLLADAATRRLISWAWDLDTGAGQSSFEVGREVIRADTSSTSHLSRWRIAQCDGQLAGALNSYLLPLAAGPAVTADVPPPLRPPMELKSIAQGSWYVSVASVFPNFRNRGIGRVLLAKAERLAGLAGARQLTLLVGSFNGDAKRLYERLGFREWHRQIFVPFDGSDVEGDWILMVKDLADEVTANELLLRHRQ